MCETSDSCSQVAQFGVAEDDPAGGRVVEPRDEIGHRGLARTRGTDERREFARLDDERDVVERRAFAGSRIRIPEGHVVEFDPAEVMRGVDRDSTRPVGDGRLQVEVLEDAREERP